MREKEKKDFILTVYCKWLERKWYAFRTPCSLRTIHTHIHVTHSGSGQWSFYFTPSTTLTCIQGKKILPSIMMESMGVWWKTQKEQGCVHTKIQILSYRHALTRMTLGLKKKDVEKCTERSITTNVELRFLSLKSNSKSPWMRFATLTSLKLKNSALVHHIFKIPREAVGLTRISCMGGEWGKMSHYLLLWSSKWKKTRHNCDKSI